MTTTNPVWPLLPDSLDVYELRDMFKKHNIDITTDQLRKLFTIVDDDNSGELDLIEFKKFATHPEANERKTINTRVQTLNMEDARDEQIQAPWQETWYSAFQLLNSPQPTSWEEQKIRS